MDEPDDRQLDPHEETTLNRLVAESVRLETEDGVEGAEETVLAYVWGTADASQVEAVQVALERSAAVRRTPGRGPERPTGRHPSRGNAWPPPCHYLIAGDDAALAPPACARGLRRRRPLRGIAGPRKRRGDRTCIRPSLTSHREH